MSSYDQEVMERRSLLPTSGKPQNSQPTLNLSSLLPDWIVNYRLSFLKADFVGAITVASLYIPLCFSFAGIGQVPPSSSLYAFVFHPLIYALLGSSPLMIVGPEATGSLLVGTVVKRLDGLENPESNAAISGIATALAGLMLLGAGAARLGFIDSTLSPPLMKGFIGGVGITLIIEQAIPGLGLHVLEQQTGIGDQSPSTKLIFLITHLSHTHRLSAIFSISSLVLVLVST